MRASVAREVFRVSVSAGRSISSIGSAVTPVASLRPCCARIVGIDDTLCRACRCRGVALWQRRVAAIVIVVSPGPDMQANRKSRIIRLGASRRCYRNRRDRQNRQSLHAHPNLPCSQTRPHSDNLCRRPDRSAVNRLACLIPMRDRMRRAARNRQAATGCGGWRDGHNGGDADLRRD